MYRIAGIIILIGLLACGTPRQLRRTFVGQPVAKVTEHFGEPVTVFDRDNGKVYIFEKIKKLGSTEVNQGKLTLDPIITPQVKKTERYYITVKDGIVVKTRMEEEYER